MLIDKYLCLTSALPSHIFSRLLQYYRGNGNAEFRYHMLAGATAVEIFIKPIFPFGHFLRLGKGNTNRRTARWRHAKFLLNFQKNTMKTFGNAHLWVLLKVAIPGLFILNFKSIAMLIDKCLCLTPAIPGHTITGQDVAMLPAQDSHLAQDVGQEFPTRFFIPVEPLRTFGLAFQQGRLIGVERTFPWVARSGFQYGDGFQLL